MFLRKAVNAKGVAYLQIAESYREEGKNRQRVLFSMGRLDVLQATGQLDRITAALSRFCQKIKFVDLSKEVSVDETFVFGSVYLLRKLFHRTPLGGIIEEMAQQHSQLEIPLVEVVFALLVSRFVSPCSKKSFFIRRAKFPCLKPRNWNWCFMTRLPSGLRASGKTWGIFVVLATARRSGMIVPR